MKSNITRRRWPRSIFDKRPDDDGPPPSPTPQPPRPSQPASGARVKEGAE